MKAINDFSLLSTDPNFTLAENVIGFSGSIDKNNRNSIYSKGKVLRLVNTNFVVLIYYRPAVFGFHAPQDSVGVSLFKDRVVVGIADGVSIVDNIKENSSGILSLSLIKQIRHVTNDLNISPFSKIKYANAASTLMVANVWEYNIETLIVGSSDNIGHLEINDGKNSSNLFNDSIGFLPNKYKTSYQKIRNESSFSIVMSSDGFAMEEKILAKFVNGDMISKMSLDEINLMLSKTANKNRDDQSLIILQKRLPVLF